MKKASRMTAEDMDASDTHDPDQILIPGMPEALPAGENVLWKGAPEWWPLACKAYHVRGIGLYFAALIIARMVTVASDTSSAYQVIIAGLWLLPLAAAGLGMLCLLAFLVSWTAIYVITDRRVIIRVGIVLNVTYNLPFRVIAGAAVREDKDGTGDIPMSLLGPDHIAYLQLWPHARPWHVNNPEPMFRAIPDVARVGKILTTALARHAKVAGIAGNTANVGPGITTGPEGAVEAYGVHGTFVQGAH